MEFRDPATGELLSSDAIMQRELFRSQQPVIAWAIPPMSSTKGHNVESWNMALAAAVLKNGRMKVVETAFEPDSGERTYKVDVVLEDVDSGNLFVAAPYTSPAVVEDVIGSSRCFALTVRDPSGRKAILGIMVQEQDKGTFNESRTMADKVLRLGQKTQLDFNAHSLGNEKITINVPTKAGRRRVTPQSEQAPFQGNLQQFAPPPPPAGGGSSSFMLAKPPSAQEVREKQKQEAKAFGFDDGEFGEFA